MMEKYTPYFESIEIPLERGDSFLWGKFKNKRAVFDSSYINDKGDLIIITDTGKEIPACRIRLVKESKFKEEHFSPFKAWYFPDKDEFIKFSTHKDHREFVDNYVDTMKSGAVRIHAFDSQVEIETKENPDNALYRKVVNTLLKKIHNFKNAIDHIDWFSAKDRHVFNLQEEILEEDLHLSDFKHHQATSDFTKDWIEIRRKIKGPANRSAKIKSIRVNRKKDYIIITFKSKPTYDSKAQSVDVKNMKMNGMVTAYTQEIKIEDIFAYLSTKPNYNEGTLTDKEVREALNVCPIKLSCNCPAETFQGLSYYLTQIDGAIYPNNIEPKRWNKYHDKNGDTGFVCKHLSLIGNQVEFFLTNITSMINSYLRKTNK